MRIAAALVLSAFVAQTPAPRGVIEGRVVRMGTQDPIPDVLITMVSLSANSAPANTVPPVEPLLPVGTIINSIAPGVSGVQPTAITDANGHFIFRDVTSGRYTIRAQRDGYFAPPINGVAATLTTANVVLGTGDAIVSKDVSMVKGGVIYGRIRDPLGQPVSGLTVSAFTVSYPNGRKIWSIARSAQTDDRGEYRLYWLTPGDYFVGATPRTPSAVPGPQDLWLRTFFPGVTDTAAAVPIRIRDGNEVGNTDIDILAASSTGFKISGTATNPLARPNPTTGVIDKSIPSFILSSREMGVLDSVNPQSILNAIPIASRPNGEFEIRNVRPGLYDLYPVAPMLTDPLPATNPAVPAQPTPETIVRTIDGITYTTYITTGGPPATRRQPTSRTPVNVNGDITGLQIVANNGIDLTGEVVVAGPAQPIKPEAIRVALRSLDTTPTAFVTLIGNISIDAAGKFRVGSVPEGRYTFQSVGGLPAGSYFADIRQGGLSVIDDGFFVDATALPVQIVISGGGASLEGTVQTADRKPGSAATVVLVPQASRRKNALLYKTAVANEDGRFTMTGIAPGPYKIFAWESIPATAWLNADYISKYEELGRSLTVPGSLEAPLNLIPRDR